MPTPSVLIVGAGVGGLAVAVQLRRHGFTDLTLLDRAPELGGTWHYNAYPGSACDVPSHLYSFSFAQDRDWSRICAPQREILAYLHDVARREGVAGCVVPDTLVTACAWSDSDRRWTVTAADGRTFGADALVLATGQLHQPAMPRLSGDGDYAGHRFHSSLWDHDYDLRGRRVAVVGTGASAVQIVPEIAEQTERLYVFQRTSNWFMPRRNRPYPMLVRTLLRRAPAIQRARRRGWALYGEFGTLQIRHPRTIGRFGRAVSGTFMRMQVRDPELRRQVIPDYPFGCKRILFSSRFLPTLQRDDVELVTDPIERLTPEGIRTVDGVERAVDCIIFATGFRTTEFMFPMEVTGREGRSLREAWSEGARAHLGVSVAGFPSMFLVFGPNTNTLGGSVIDFEEAQADYIRQAIELIRDAGAPVEVHAEVEAASDRATQARLAGTAWMECNSWYRDANGRVVTNWPGYVFEYVRRLRRIDPGEYRIVGSPERTPALS